MRAARIHRFGPPEAIELDEVQRPEPGADEVLVRVAAAGVGPWDALIREKKSAVSVPLPLTLGSDIAGVVEQVGSGVRGLSPGDEVYGATNPQFIGGYAEYAAVQAGMIARKPRSLSFEEAASAPVIAVTAWQMLFDYAKARAGQSVLIHGAAGNVGAYAVQMARRAGLHIFATAAGADENFVRGLGAETVVDYRSTRFEDVVPRVDIVLDMVGGETRQRSFGVIAPGGILVSVVSNEPSGNDVPGGVRSVFFLVDVTTERLERLTELFDAGELKARVGTVLPLEEARRAHEMLGGAPHEPGKIVLRMSGGDQAAKREM
ncbi:MAG TPA: NADP-dependent oxidoreductase [Acidobacteriaceae bacterium]|nr:NADP-dependent oxidoreductase [Acidobacteriaceae bacterium]